MRNSAKRILLAGCIALPISFTSSIAHSAPIPLSNNWISCSDNSRIRNLGTDLQLNSECVYQELAAPQTSQLDLSCDVETADFSSIQLAYSDSGFNVLNTASDSTTTNTRLQTSLGTAPANAQLVVVTLFTNSTTRFNCALDAPVFPTSQSSTQPFPSVPQLSPPTTPQVLPQAGPCIDSDGDGFGWNGIATCRITAATVTLPPLTSVSTQACIDSDGDGFGWNGVATCLVSSANSGGNSVSGNSASFSTTTPAGLCVDSDGDGFGWNGVATCLVGAVTNNTANNASSPQASSPQVSDITDLILITGQSNAQGDGTTVDLAGADRPDNRVFAYTDDNGWQVADLRQHWDGPLEPRHPGRNALLFANNTPHNNFALHFAKALVSLDPQRVVGFVLVTSPGAGIRKWDREASFFNVVTNKAMQALNASSKTTFDAVLWHQGETDFQFFGTSDLTAPEQQRLAPDYYPQRLNRLISNLRVEPWFTSSKPVFICGETQSTSNAVAPIAPVNQRLLELNFDNDPYTGCVGSDGLMTDDGIHFNANSLRELGRRYAVEYLNLSQ